MGIISFASPCILPLIPSYVSYITGISFDELVGPDFRRKNIRTTVLHSLAFVAGFTVVFVLLGATANLLGQMLIEYLKPIRIIGGVLLIVMGLFVTDIVPIPFLQRDAKLHLKTRPAGYIGTFLVGVIFAAGWTPCTGPFLAAVLMQAAQSETMMTGMVFLAFYSIGIGIPFILSAVAISAFLSSFKRVKEYLHAIKIGSGVILVVMGILLITDKWTLLTSYLMNP
ncbi:MAG: cytochrome c biogenesis protein CcdA [Nitrospirota bacterium]|nr:cytochrome c biogenesis protein CcdA [Nitrospirota bacterium]